MAGAPLKGWLKGNPSPTAGKNPVDYTVELKDGDIVLHLHLTVKDTFETVSIGVPKKALDEALALSELL